MLASASWPSVAQQPVAAAARPCVAPCIAPPPLHRPRLCAAAAAAPATASSSSSSSQQQPLEHDGEQQQVVDGGDVQGQQPRTKAGKGRRARARPLVSLEEREAQQAAFEADVKAAPDRHSLQVVLFQHGRLSSSEIVLACNQMAKLCEPQKMNMRAWGEVQVGGGAVAWPCARPHGGAATLQRGCAPVHCRMRTHQHACAHTSCSMRMRTCPHTPAHAHAHAHPRPHTRAVLGHPPAGAAGPQPGAAVHVRAGGAARGPGPHAVHAQPRVAHALPGRHHAAPAQLRPGPHHAAAEVGCGAHAGPRACRARSCVRPRPAAYAPVRAHSARASSAWCTRRCAQGHVPPARRPVGAQDGAQLQALDGGHPGRGAVAAARLQGRRAGQDAAGPGGDALAAVRCVDGRVQRSVQVGGARARACMCMRRTHGWLAGCVCSACA